MNEFFNKVKEFVLNNKKTVIIVSAAVLAVILLVTVLLLIGGGKEPAVTPDPTDPTSQTAPQDQKTEYKITIKNDIGVALSGVPVSLYADDTLYEMVGFGKTDDDGVVTIAVKPGDGYAAVLDGLPAGYAVQESYAVSADTQIVLSACGGSITEMEGKLSVGDPVPNFTVTTLDGAAYTLSDLIAQGKPVVLNFWYENCEPCKAEFPHIQAAYEQYSDSVVLLALNIEDSADVVETFAQTSGFDLPFAVGDPCWRDLLKIIAYPTTAVIDRYGYLSVVHTGTLPDTKVFTNLFEVYNSVNYQHTTYQTIDDIMIGVPGDTEENPLEFSGAESYRLTLMPDQTIYCAFYRVGGMLMSIANENVSVTYNGQTYNAVDGYVKLMVNSADPFTPVCVAITNLGGQKDFDVDFSYVPGSMGAPFELEMGPIRTEINAGNDQGVYYTYTCDGTGKLTVAVNGATEGVEYNCVLFNQTTGMMVSSQEAVADPETGILSISVDVNAGDVVQLVASTMMDANFEFPAAVLDLEVSFKDGEGTVNYTVTVTDKSGSAIPGVSLTITGDGVDMDVTTNADGAVSVVLAPGTYTVTPNIPLGYQAEATSFELTEAAPTLAVILENVSNLPTEEDPDDTEPTDPQDPTDPEQPTVPDETAKPTDPDATVKPTEKPTEPDEPDVTVKPTKPTEPTVKPTDPTQAPTEKPTKPTDPTQAPTEKPTKPTDPTQAPTEKPTKPTDPTQAPTEKPTEPTVKPTDPTQAPTEKPTEPKDEPTDPTQAPTEKPTEPTLPTYTPDPEVEGETRENTLWLGNDVTSHNITVKPGYTIYLNKLVVDERQMTITGEDFTLVINAPDDKKAKTLYPENGELTQIVSPHGIGTTVYLDLTNTTGEEQTYTIEFSSLPGSWDNPEKVKLDEFELKLKKGKESGYFYTYTAESDGVFTLSCVKCTDGVVYGLTITNNGTGGQNAIPDQYAITSVDGNSLSVEVKAGDKLVINVAAIENDFGPYPKATFKLNAQFEEN